MKLMDSVVFHGGRTADHPVALRVEEGAPFVYVQHNVSTMMHDRSIKDAVGGIKNLRPFLCKYRSA